MAVIALGVNFCSLGTPPPNKSENSSKSTTGAESISPMSLASVGGSLLWLCVFGIRKILAASAVTAASACSACSTHNFFKRSATGNHASTEQGVANVQYTCTPLPELTITGFGRDSFFTNLRRSFNASR